MDNLFFLLSLLSLVALVTGLIKPSLFTKAMRGQATRMRIAMAFGSLTFIFLVLVGIFTDTTIPFQEIRSAYENDKHAAVAKYGGDVLKVKGNVIEVKTDLEKASHVDIGDSHGPGYSYLRCIFDTPDNTVNSAAISKAATLQQGQTVVVGGKMDSGLIANIVMHECAVAD